MSFRGTRSPMLMLDDRMKDFRPPQSLSFRPHPIQPPAEFSGCFCVGQCLCRYESLQYITPEGLFAPFAPLPQVDPPRVCVWMHLSREDLKHLNAANFCRQTAFNIFAKRFRPPPGDQGHDALYEILLEALRFCRINSFSHKQTSALVSMYYITHLYYLSSLWRLPDDTYAYFKECLLLHTVQRPPKSAEILEPQQSVLALKHFISTYLRYLPLIHCACLPQARLQLIWPQREPTPAPTPAPRDSVEDSDMLDIPGDRPRGSRSRRSGASKLTMNIMSAITSVTAPLSSQLELPSRSVPFLTDINAAGSFAQITGASPSLRPMHSTSASPAASLLTVPSISPSVVSKHLSRASDKKTKSSYKASSSSLNPSIGPYNEQVAAAFLSRYDDPPPD